ncbi:MAG: gliding motility-associated C-terminal domain-containing protein [Bacteroidales bacterium]|nr:gliding motility-associated C-terminal domain-containing protein [Bacteroidales bacterium]
MRYNETDKTELSGFPPVPEDAPAPSEAVWEGIQRSLKRKDFWRVKGKVLLMAAIACITTVTLLQLSGPATEIRPDPQPVTGNALPEPVQAAREEAGVPAAVPERQPASVIQAPQPSATAPAEHHTPALAPLSEPVLEITETVAETPLPLPERPIPSAVRATGQPETAASQPATETLPAEPLRPHAAEKEATLQITFPSAFTPNGDGLNDTYRPVLSGEASQYLFRIYNRKNQLLFQSSRPEEAWDGTFHGTPQPHGVYVSTVVCTGTDGERQTAKGEFLLLRD